ncbi:MAG: BamA/TamA family outer membrane protein [Crocinitomicaceae bacterium]|nr:BamA/TamA family outer membrane protein [Crocinitomicaceae bacterium]
MNPGNRRYLLILFFALAFASCRQAKYVPDDYYLLKENNTEYYVLSDSTGEWQDNHSQIDEGDLEDLIRPETNNGFRLWVYNRIDTGRYQKQVIRKRKKFNKKNERRQAREDRINKKRIQKARKKGKEKYKKKTIKDKAVRLGWRHWVLDHWGEPPVILDTAKISKSRQQMKVYLSKKGFKYGEVTDSITYNEKKQKASVTYYVNPGKPYIIDSIWFHKTVYNRRLIGEYEEMKRKEGTDLEVGDLLDEDKLDDERDHMTTYFKDKAFFGFTKSYINFIVDTTVGDFKAHVAIYIKPREIPDPNNPDTTRNLQHYTYYVGEVTYKLHNPDSASFNDWEGYKKRCEAFGYSWPYRDENQNYYLLDTMFIEDTTINTYYINFEKNRRKKCGLFGKCIDTTINYKGYFIYNEEPFLKPTLLDKQNFLEHTDIERDDKNFAKDYYIDRTFKSFYRLDVFSRVTPNVGIRESEPLGRFVDVSYDLTPAPKQQFTIEPRATNTASILGVSGRISYVNKNLFRSGHQLKISVEGGLQSQPLVGGSRDDSTTFRFRGLNTFEFSPEITYKIPRFFPMTKKMRETVSKRAYPSTEITALYNYQKRPEFSRHIAEFGYRWKFSIPPDEIQRVTITPLVFNYVFLNKTAEFDSVLNKTNDPFLINSYSDFLSIGILNARHEYTNAALPKRKRKKRYVENTYSNVVDLNAAGLIVNTIYAMADKNQNFTESFNDTNKVLFGVPFTQYAKLTNTTIYNMYVNKNHRVATRLIMGAGFTYGNGFALPYTQSFVGGGSNDIRAFAARTMAPGGTQVWADTNATETQIGDMKLELNVEWRFRIAGQLHGAIFTDIGNIWKINSDSASNDPGVFNFNTFYKQVAIGVGFGVRYDLTFLILRLDVSWPLHNPYLPEGARWWRVGDKSAYVTAVKEQQANYDFRDWPHGPTFNFGIGYPF